MERFCLTQQICMPLFQLLLCDSVKSQLPFAILESGTSTLSSLKVPILFLADQGRAKATHWFWEMTFSTFFATWPWPLLTMKHAEMVDGRWSWKLMEIRYTNFKHCPFYLLNHETYETNCLIHILLCKYIIDLKALSPLRSSTSSYENRVSKNFVFFLNFPCLSLVAYVVFVYLFVCFFFGGGGLGICVGSGCRGNFANLRSL